MLNFQSLCSHVPSSDLFLAGIRLNRPLALPGLMTNALFKQRLGILLLTKNDRVHKNDLTPKILKEMHLREIFYGIWLFNKEVCFVLAAMLEGILLPFNVAAKTTFCLYLVKRLVAKLSCKHYHIIFSTSSRKFKCKISVQNEVIHSFKNHILVTWPAMNLLILRKWCWFERLNVLALLFCLLKIKIH